MPARPSCARATKRLDCGSQPARSSRERHESATGVGRGGSTNLAFAAQPQRRPAGDQGRHAGRRLQQLAHERRGGQQMLEVVEHEQELT